MHARIIFTLGLTLTLGAAPARGITFLDQGYGTPLDAGSARAAALASVGSALFTGSAAGYRNPALLAGPAREGRWFTDLSVSLTQANENAYIPLFDTFDDFVGETAIALNRNTYVAGEGGIVWNAGGERAFGVALSLHDRYDTQYDYLEEVRDPSPQATVRDRILQLNDIQSDGRLRVANLAVGAEITSMFQVGAGVNYMFGTLTSQVREAPTDGMPTIAFLERDLAGAGVVLGGTVRPTPRLTFGVSYESSSIVSGDHVAYTEEDGNRFEVAPGNGDYEIEYPKTWSFALAYQPQHQVRTTFSLEAVHRFWSEVTDEFADAQLASGRVGDGFRDTWDLRAGAEHVFYNGLPVRFGFRYLENYAHEETARAIFSVGVGQKVESYRIDITGQYHHQNLFRDFAFARSDLGATQPRVEDSVIRVLLGVTRDF